jgi:uncharacterized protein YqeY
MKQAMKGKDKLRLSVIRMVRAAMKNQEIDSQNPLTEDDVIAIVRRELKQRRDSLLAFESAGRTDLADEAKAEISVLLAYLPQQLSESEVRSLVEESISTVGAKGKSDIGKVMADIMPKIRGRADGKMVQQIVQSLL